jgi:aryl-alcohol dehydrogenase-like predicted oxidoreductase
MQYRTIQNTDLQLSAIGTGCWAFGGGDYWGAQDQNDATAVVHASVAHGINYFDTAEVYNDGRSESSLGEAIKGIPRERLIIGSKVSPSNAYAKTLVKHCEDSLSRLQTDYIDIYMIHWPIHPHSIRHFTGDEAIISNPPTIHEAFEAMQQLQQSGKIRYIGLSNFSYNRLKHDVPASVQVAVNELPYNLLCRAVEYDTLPYCTQNGVGVIGYMTLLQGILTGKYASLADVPEWQRRTRHFNSAGTPKCRHGEPGFEHETAEALKGIEAISRKYGIKMSELATQWAIQSGVTCALVGARNVKQLEENVKALDAPVTPEIIQELNEVTNELKEKLGNHFDYYESAGNDRTL